MDLVALEKVRKRLLLAAVSDSDSFPKGRRRHSLPRESGDESDSFVTSRRPTEIDR